jgi:hypothetical protein
VCFGIKVAVHACGGDIVSDLTNVTIDHDEIRAWTEERGGKPAHVKRTGENGEDPGILRIAFPAYGREDNLEPISWEEWFEKFDERGLAFLHEERTTNDEVSYFNKLVSRETVKDQLKEQGTHKKAHAHHSSSGKASKTSAGKK